MSDTKRIIHGKEFVFYDREHLYTWGGQAVPGVTSILDVVAKPLLVPWAKKVTRNYWLEAVKSGRTDFEKIHKESWNASEKIRVDAADIGTNVHDYVDCFFKKEPLPALLTDAAKRAVGAFHDWLAKHSVEVIESEKILFSRNHFYAGTCDFIARIDGELGVGDVKTSSGIWDEYWLQTAAYQQAIQEETGETFGVRWIIRFDKETGKFEPKSSRDFELDFAGFLGAYELHKSLNTIKARSKQRAG